MTFVVDAADANGTGNGDVCIRTDKGTLVALVYAADGTLARANVIAQALNSAFGPFHTGGLPSLPDDDSDFTPDLARAIIVRYQQLLGCPAIPPGDGKHRIVVKS